jgi:ribonucleoside-triphosphate reductase (thioredoxin)
MLADYVFKSKYARHNAAAGRRETWREAVERTTAMHRARFPEELAQIAEVQEALEARQILPSMRGLQFAGAGVTRKNMRLYNCTSSYCDRPRFFAEALWLLLAGSGVGFSVQRHHVARLPSIKRPRDRAEVYTIPDSIEGWAEATHRLFSAYMEPDRARPVFDYTLIRRAGSPLSVGGTAPGPAPLKQALEGIEDILRGAIGRHLRPIEAFDATMYLADCTRTAGTRRSATIAIFDADDAEMMSAKTTAGWWETHPQRARANISAVITPDTPRERFTEIFSASRAYGEPGLVYLDSTEWAVNPCAEILMCPTLITRDGEAVERYTPELLDPRRRAEHEAQGYRFESGWSACNLTTINVAAASSEAGAEHLALLARLAARLGTYQAAYTDTGYLGVVSRRIIEREALLGVSLCGMAARPDLTTNADTLRAAALAAVDENRETAARIGIRQASRVTCVKPEGTASLVLGTSSGIHPAHARHYLRRVQASEAEPIFRAFRAVNPRAVERSQWGSDYAALFACEGQGTTREEISALDLLARACIALSAWVKPGTARPSRLVGGSHNVSLTLSVKADEWADVEADLWAHRAQYRGVSLLGATGDYDYPQAPFQAIYTDEEIDAQSPTPERRAEMIKARETWELIKATSRPVDYEALNEATDTTAPLAVDACAGGMCELR